MTEPRLPNEALDEQEREIARILRALPGGEPPPALDARILRAAANAAATTRRPRARWLAPLGSFWGAGAAAAAVLALGVSWQMLDPTHKQAGEVTSPASISQESDADSAVIVGLGQDSRPERPAAAPPPPPLPTAPFAADRPRQRVSPSSPAPPMAAPASPPAPAPAAVAAAPEAFPEQRAEVAAAPAEPMADAPETSGFTANAQATQDQYAAADALAEREESARSKSDATVAQAAKALARESAAPTPSEWLSRVRKLHAADRIEEARASLREFRKQYPGHTIPSDLAPLLRE